jgi:hypothetical protein
MATHEPFYEKVVDRTPYRSCWGAALVAGVLILTATLFVSWAAGSLKDLWQSWRPQRLTETTTTQKVIDTGTNLLDKAQEEAQRALQQKQDEATQAATDAAKKAATDAANQAITDGKQQLQNLLSTPTPAAIPTPQTR